MSNLKNTLSVRCHGNFKSICVTPLPYNTSEPWEKVKAHLQGVWTSSSISHDIDSLQKDISAMSQSHLQLGGLQQLASSLQSNVKALNPLDWLQYFIFLGIIVLLFLIVIFLFPPLISCLFKSLKTVQQDIFELHFKNKKGGTATPTAVTPV